MNRNRGRLTRSSDDPRGFGAVMGLDRFEDPYFCEGKFKKKNYCGAKSDL